MDINISSNGGNSSGINMGTPKRSKVKPFGKTKFTTQKKKKPYKNKKVPVGKQNLGQV